MIATHFNSAVFASCTSSFAQSPVATSGWGLVPVLDPEVTTALTAVGCVVVVAVVVVACGATVLGPATGPLIIV